MPSANPTRSTPEANELEISMFSRGYGESIVIHVGNGQWIVVDSLITKDRIPVALDYLSSIGDEPPISVCAILLTHWHDDHVKGAGEIVRSCRQACVAMPGALVTDEFKRFMKAAGMEDEG